MKRKNLALYQKLISFSADCSWPQGIGNRKLSDDQITASTSFNDLHLPFHARLGQIAPNSLGGWCPYKNEKDEYLQFDFGNVKRIAGKDVFREKIVLLLLMKN